MKRTKSKKSRGLVTRRIMYQNLQYPRDRPHEVKVDVRAGEIIDTDYAAAMVAVRTGISLRHVKIVKIAGIEE